MSLFETPRLDDTERAVLERIDELQERLGYLVGESPRRWQGLLRRNTFARVIRGSNSIEGYNISVEDAVAAAVGEEPVEAQADTWKAIMGYRSAMTFVLQLAKSPDFAFSTDLIKSLHFMMLEYDLSKNPGVWRPGAVYVREEPSGKIVFEGPPADAVRGFMDELVASLQQNNQGHSRIVAAMAHLNFVMIHPFSDGNGRMARCLQSLVLARNGPANPFFSSIEEYLGANTQDYYHVLAEVGHGAWHPERDTRPWIRFCLKAHFIQATTLLRRTREYEKLWMLMEEEIRREGLPERVAFALHDAATGFRVRNPTYRAAAEVSKQVAGNDLKAAVVAGLLVPQGERRGRCYVASAKLVAMRARVREPKGVVDPFLRAAKPRQNE